MSSLSRALVCCSISVWGQKVRTRGHDQGMTPKAKSRPVQADIRKVRDPRYNKVRVREKKRDRVRETTNLILPVYLQDLAFTYKERQHLNVMGLLPAAYQDMELQLYGVCRRFHAHKENLDKYAFLRELRCRNERLFYSFLNAHVAETLPVMYTPTVGAACLNFSNLLYHYALGMYVTKYDKGHMVDVIKNWPFSDIRAVCVTDGERILGLGDQGANGMGISVGKLDLYSILAKISPEYLIPMVLDVGTNNKQLHEDPLYIGVREPRLRGEEYDEIVQEFVDAIVECFGSQCIIHFEDFATPNAFRLINKYQDKYCCFNDDVQGTAAVGLGGFLGVERITKVPLQEHVFLFVGAGSACLGMAKLLVRELLHRKVSKDAVTKNIYITDVDGVLTKKSKNLLPDMKPFLKKSASSKSLEEIVNKVKPSMLIGATGQGGIFTENIIRAMAMNHKQPGIFACSNPTNKSECTAEQAITFSEVRLWIMSCFYFLYEYLSLPPRVARCSAPVRLFRPSCTTENVLNMARLIIPSPSRASCWPSFAVGHITYPTNSTYWQHDL